MTSVREGKGPGLGARGRGEPSGEAEECLQSLPTCAVVRGEGSRKMVRHQMVLEREQGPCRKTPPPPPGLCRGGGGEDISLFSTFAPERALFSSPADDLLDMLGASNVETVPLL